jgi:hypothetical protein
MPLSQRVLNVTFELPSGDVTLDSSMDMHVHIEKQALAAQASCVIDVFGLSQSLREALLSQFTAWNKRMYEQGDLRSPYIDMNVTAGYKSATQTTTTMVFSGQVAMTEPMSAPPNIGTRITCYSQQLSRAQYVTNIAPVQARFYDYVQWVGEQMGVDRVVCETSYNDTIVTNPSGTTEYVSGLLIDIQTYYRPNVAAFIDNNALIVMDQNKVIAERGSVTIDEFIGTPMWTEWGVEFKTLYNPKIQLAGAATLKSLLNPSLNRTFVITALKYDLASRDEAFYVMVNGAPPA